MYVWVCMRQVYKDMYNLLLREEDMRTVFFFPFPLNITIYVTHFKGYALWKDGKQSEGLCTTSLYLQSALFFWCSGIHFLDSIRYNHNMNAILMIEKELEVWDYKSLNWWQREKKFSQVAAFYNWRLDATV